jgi:hypothetical protein
MVSIQEDDLGVAALVISLLGYSICWIPGVGWLGCLMGVISCALGITALVHWFQRPHYTAYGISAVLIGSFATGLALAFQVKHAAGALDFLLFSSATPTAYYSITAMVAVFVSGILLARLKSKPAGVVLATLAIIALMVTTGSTLHTADQNMASQHQSTKPFAPKPVHKSSPSQQQ